MRSRNYVYRNRRSPARKRTGVQQQIRQHRGPQRYWQISCVASETMSRTEISRKSPARREETKQGSGASFKFGGVPECWWKQFFGFVVRRHLGCAIGELDGRIAQQVSCYCNELLIVSPDHLLRIRRMGVPFGCAAPAGNQQLTDSAKSIGGLTRDDRFSQCPV